MEFLMNWEGKVNFELFFYNNSCILPNYSVFDTFTVKIINFAMHTEDNNVFCEFLVKFECEDGSKNDESKKTKLVAEIKSKLGKFLSKNWMFLIIFF